MKIVVTGGSGQLAHAIKRFWTGHEVILPPESSLDLSSPEAIRSVICGLKPQVVINAGAFTQVDRCETELALAMQVNGEAVGWLAAACAELDACLVQISTDYVFDGKGSRPYLEDDPPCPLSVYGQSKLAGEQKAREGGKHLIVRTSWLYDAWGNNFHNTMLQLGRSGKPLKVVDDQRGAPTSCRALARQLQVAVDRGWSGTLNMTCAGETTWYGFASEIFRLHGMDVDLQPCTTHDFPRPARRPAYSVLDARRRRELGLDMMPEWRSALAEIAEEVLRNGREHA